MPCCGKSQVKKPADAAVRGKTPPEAARHKGMVYFDVLFEYSGARGITVVGPVSGRRYHFAAAGARVRIDPRDRRSLTAVPHLRQI